MYCDEHGTLDYCPDLRFIRKSALLAEGWNEYGSTRLYKM
jgi:hypothetical protein